MRINSVPDKNYFSNRQITTKEEKQKNIPSKDKELKDEYIPTQKEEKTGIYKKPMHKVDMDTIQKLKEESERTYSHLKEMVRQLLERQGLTFKDLVGLESEIKVDEETRLEAQAMIAEGGPLSPEGVSDNIIAFAKAISGGDKEKIDLLRSAIEEGFKQAANILGGELPEVCQKTYDLTMEKLDAWKAEE
ncbi:hypothetical protein [Clostridium formicaceticum]|uniref:Uncharacterized protein n=1 Tax=Clostridium formicaceticum TaxID=1497 RepID=A0AAC9WEQ0_9CLOT|nr:hypothetical protein [Clostridium formicaceticum]AOY75676.1 hypothetical protein BJL90_07070 [Clostridium formicaceticum]ARE85992.1 hypothetical protein CLFO_03080 [Clostridium formicaceticum]